MAIDIAIDTTTKDLDLTGGRVNFTSDRIGIARQRIESTVALIRGEWSLDLDAGLDWRELLRQKLTEPVQRAVIDAVLADRDVASATIQVERGASRAASVTGIARLVQGGETNLEVEI